MCVCVCVCVCVSDQFRGAASRKRSLMIKRPLKQTSETSVRVFLRALSCVCVCVCVCRRARYPVLCVWRGEMVKLPWLIFCRQIGCNTRSTKPEYNRLCCHRLKSVIRRIDCRQSRGNLTEQHFQVDTPSEPQSSSNGDFVFPISPPTSLTRFYWNSDIFLDAPPATVMTLCHLQPPRLRLLLQLYCPKWN